MASKTCLLLKIQILDAEMDHEMNPFLITSIDALIFAKASAFLHNPRCMKFHGLGKVGVIMMCEALCSSFADGCSLGEITLQ